MGIGRTSFLFTETASLYSFSNKIAHLLQKLRFCTFFSDAPVRTHLADALRSAYRGVGGNPKFLPPKNCHSPRTLWGLPAPTPRGCFAFLQKLRFCTWLIGGCAPPHPAVHFWTPKSEPKNRQTQGFGILFLSRYFLIWKISVPNYILYLICGLVVVDASAFGPVKGVYLSFGA